jgi:general secretion pathway protein D
VTISSGRPVPKRDLVPVLENALRMSNVVLVAQAGGGYKLVPGGDAQGAGGIIGEDSSEAGYGISVVPLRYVSAQTILKLLDSFALKPGMARVDTGHNLILVEGTGPERKDAVDAILSFDADWMRGQSVGIYPLQNAAPEIMIKELDKIMESGDGGLNQNLVTLQPVARLNAVLVVTKRPGLLRQAATWIARLDRANNAGTSVHVYRLRYGDARQIAKVLGDLFGAQSAGLNSAANQIAPGSGLTGQSSGLGGTQEGTSGAALGTGTGATSGVGLPGSNGTGSTAGLQLGNTGMQLGNMGNGFGNAQGLSGTNGSIEQGAFGNNKEKGQSSVVLPGVRIAADESNNSLVVFASQENYRLIEETLAQLDRPQLQVAIHATVAEVDLNNDLQFGVEYYLQNANASAGFNTQASSSGALNSQVNSTTGVSTTTAVSQMLSAVLPGGNLLLGPQTNPRVVINALRNITDVKVLSSPSVVVLDNQPATLLVGDQVPVETQTATFLTTTGTTLNSINYINTGVILQVLPRINVNGTVVLNVEQEVSNVQNNGAAQSLTPTVSQRQIKSAIAVASGQTVLLGGLISETQDRSRSGIPILEELPGGLGNLFSTNDRSTNRQEIIIFIEPEIIRNSVDASRVAEELRAKMRGSANNVFQPGPSLSNDPRFAQ